jgi:hypothetical protein
VTSASATATTIVVTSKQIKNGTIQTVDVSAKAKRALKGNRGPRGLRGLAGGAGSAGNPGQPGAAGATVRTARHRSRAVVLSDRSLVRGSRAVSSSISPSGVYTVTFDQAVDNCAYVATFDGDASPGEITVRNLLSAPAVVAVRTFTSAGNTAPHTFHLAVACQMATPDRPTICGNREV